MGRIIEYHGVKGATYGVRVWFRGRKIERMCGPDRRVAERELKKIEGRKVEGRSIGPSGDAPIRFQALAEEVVEWGRATRAPASAETYHHRLKPLVFAFGDWRLGEITRRAAERYVIARRKLVGPHTINGELETLKLALRLAHEWEYTADNYSPRVKLLPRPQGRTRYASGEEWALIWGPDGLGGDFFREPVRQEMRAAVALGAHGGLRKGEIADLTRDRVDSVRRTITLVKTKGKRVRTVPINDFLAAELARLPVRLDGRLLSLHSWSICRYFHKLCRHLGLPDFRLHDLRRTCGSWIVMQTGDLRAAQLVLGHAKISQTAEAYAHLAERHLHQAVAALDTSEICRGAQRPSETVRNLAVGGSKSA